MYTIEMQSLVTAAVANKSRVIAFFKIIHFTVLMLIGIGVYVTLVKNELYIPFYTLAVYAGRAALIAFTIALLPGMGRRLGFASPLLVLIQLFRRHVGILTFLLALFHALVVRMVDRFTGGMLFSNLPTFEVFSTFALFGLLAMFLTSNDFSVVRMGGWWKKLHSIVYVIAWLLFGHTIFQRVSEWSILIGIVAVLEVISWIAVYMRRRSTQPVPPPLPPTS
jgi:DMSO/TMAO reductase YedYZ heme-binding membrane subunit